MMVSKANKELYRKQSDQGLDLPVFLKDWWLDAVCGNDNWDVVLTQAEDGKLNGVFPFMIKSSLGLKKVIMPTLTPYLGPWLIIPNGLRNYKQISLEIQILQDLIRQLPSFAMFKQNFSYNSKNMLPFYWSGFSYSTFYSYVISDTSDTEDVYDKFENRIKRHIKKAQKKLIVEESENIDILYDLAKKTFKRQNRDIPYSRMFLRNLDLSCQKHNCGKILIAKDSSGIIYGSMYVVWDKYFLYYLIGGMDPEFKNSGVSPLLMWEAIKISSKLGLAFNFEGSMVDSIENYFRSFGGELFSYFRVTKVDSRFIELYKFVKNVISKSI